MYADTDFLLALLEEDDWLQDAAEAVYREHETDLRTSEFTLVELLLVAYREDMDVERVVANAASLLRIDGDPEKVVEAAGYVAEHGLTPFDAIHLVESGGDTIVSSDDSYEELAPRLDISEYEE